ncbi:MAG: hypothetical protein ACWGMZ_02900 [Thermoguttaceae bacterium]
MCVQRLTLENPFCSRRIRPGALPYCFLPGDDVEKIIDLLRKNNWRGAIVGPHGSGKSTLLAAILPALEKIGCRAVLFQLHDGQRNMPPDWRGCCKLSPSTAPVIIAVDGYEQLGFWSRIRVKWTVQRRRLGLLVTSHVWAGLPVIYHPPVSLEMTGKIVEQLLEDGQISVPQRILAELFAKHQGNVREVLFDLYDFVEQNKTY